MHASPALCPPICEEDSPASLWLVPPGRAEHRGSARFPAPVNVRGGPLCAGSEHGFRTLRGSASQEVLREKPSELVVHLKCYLLAGFKCHLIASGSFYEYKECC